MNKRLCLPVALFALLIPLFNAHAFGVQVTVSASWAGMSDGFDSCFFFDVPTTACTAGPVVNRVAGDASAVGSASLAGRSITFRAASGESVNLGAGSARVEADLSDTYMLKVPASTFMTIGVVYTVSGSVVTESSGQSQVDMGLPSGITLDKQNFAGGQIVFPGSYTETRMFGIPAGSTGFIPVSMSFVAQIFGDSIADFSTTASVSFTGPAGVELVSESGQSFTLVPIPAAMWLFASALGLLGWIRRRTA